MDKKILKIVRIFTTGILITVLVVAIIKPELLISPNFLDNLIKNWNVPTISSIPSFFLAYLLYEHTKSLFWPKVTDNIKCKLLEISQINFSIQQERELFNGTILMNGFYKIIDDDKSLTQRSGEIMVNGSFVTFFSFLFFFSFINNFIQSLFLIIQAQNHTFDETRVKILILSSILSPIAYLIMHILIKNHINRSNDQLNYIKDFKAQEVKTFIQDHLNKQNNVQT